MDRERGRHQDRDCSKHHLPRPQAPARGRMKSGRQLLACCAVIAASGYAMPTEAGPFCRYLDANGSVFYDFIFFNHDGLQKITCDLDPAERAKAGESVHDRVRAEVVAQDNARKEQAKRPGVSIGMTKEQARRSSWGQPEYI